MKLVPDIDYTEFIGKQESQYVRPASSFTDALRERRENGGLLRGAALPWSKTKQNVRLRPGEVTIWGGIGGHGKSLLTGQCLLWLLSEYRSLIASLEMKPEATLERMIRQASGTTHPHENFDSQFLKWTDDKLWIYDQLDTVPSDRILGLCHYAAKELGIKHIVIDSLMKCGIRKDDYDGQTAFIDRICWAAKSLNIHIHLVHHMRKGEKEEHRPGKFDIRGAGELVDMVDNLFICHRNKAKERKMDDGEIVDFREPDCTLTVAKQRHGEWEGTVALWFDAPSLQFVSEPGQGAMRYDMEQF